MSTTTAPGPVSDASFAQAFRADPIAVLRDLARRYGPLVRFEMAGTGVYLLCDPALIQEALGPRQHDLPKRQMRQGGGCLLGRGLMTSEGELNRLQRRRLRTLFAPARWPDWIAVMSDEVQRHLGGWSPGQALQSLEDMGKLTLSVAARCLLGEPLAEQDQLRRALVDCLEAVGEPGALEGRLRVARLQLDGVTDGLLARRRQEGARGNDMVSLLLRLRGQEEDSGGEVLLSDELIRDEVITMLLGAHETTATALAWALRLVGENPPVRQRLEEELDREGAFSGSNLPYTRAVFAESLRMYPPGWIIGRSVAHDTRVGDWRLEKGAAVLISAAVTHYDPRWWPEPERFRPERFLEASPPLAPPLSKGGASPPPLAPPLKAAFFPFGGGDRVCIGESFAWVAGQALLSEISRGWRLVPVKPGPLPLLPLAALRPNDPMEAHLERRSR